MCRNVADFMEWAYIYRMQGEPSSKITQVQQARHLIREAHSAALSTLMPDNAGPYGSLVICATFPDGAPMLLLSSLAVHTANLMRDPRACLLFDATDAQADPLAGARLSLIGRITRAPELELCRTRFLGRHPSAAAYASFDDFRFYRMQPDRAHLVAGFGQIHWIEAPDLLHLP